MQAVKIIPVLKLLYCYYNPEELSEDVFVLVAYQELAFYVVHVLICIIINCHYLYNMCIHVWFIATLVPGKSLEQN